MHSSVIFTIPSPAIPRIKLANRDRMLMYIDDDHINVMRMGPRDMKPKWPCEIRTVSYTGGQAKLILPASICKSIQPQCWRRAQDTNRKETDGTDFILLKPARPTLRIRMQHSEN